MKKAIALILVVIVTISFYGCSKSPRGFYVTEDSPPKYCMEFKSNGKVIIRDLAAESPTADESSFVVEKNVIRIHALKLGDQTTAVEFSIVGDTLISAKGARFIKDTSGRKYTPAELLEEARLRRQQAEAERQALYETQRQIHFKDNQKKEAELQKTLAEEAALRASEALGKKEEQERAKAIETAKRNAIEHLPDFTNTVATIQCNDGVVYANILLKRCSLDGIVYSYTNVTGGGMIPYTKLNADTFEALNIDTNMIAVGREQELAKAEIDRHYKEVLASEGATKANEYRKGWVRALEKRSAQEAYYRRYGNKR